MRDMPEPSLDPRESLEDRLARIEEEENDRALLADLVESSDLLTPEEWRNAKKYCDDLYDLAVAISRASWEVG